MNASTKRLLATLLVFSCLTALPLHRSAAEATPEGDIAVVVHSETPVSELSLADVREVFLGERQFWHAEVPATLVIRAPVTRERDVATRVICQTRGGRFKQYWVAKVAGAERVLPPVVVDANG